MLPRYVSEQDVEDHEQEKLINDWLKKAGSTERVESAYTNSQGNLRGSFNKPHVSLDQKVFEEDGFTYADIIAGSDGRDLVDGEEEFNPEDFYTVARETLTALGLKKGETQWLIRTWLQSETLNEMPSLISMIDSEWENL